MGVGMILGGSKLRYSPRMSSVRLPAHALDKPGKHSLDFGDAGFQTSVLSLRKKTEIASQQQKVFEFARRTCGVVKKLAEFCLAGTSAALRNIGGDRSSRPPHLACESVTLGIRKSGRRRIDSDHKRMALLPDFQLFEILHASTDQISPLFVYLQLNTDNCQPFRGVLW
jgi:hypothetical protein